MTRKRCHRRPIAPMPPRGLRPKLAPDQVRDLGLAHIVNLDAIARGQADEAILWQWIGGVLTWSKVAELIELGEPEMRAQIDLATSLVERYGRTGRIGFSGPEYQLAKAGVVLMDQLAAVTDRATATAAAEWSERRIAQMAAQCTHEGATT
jgi:hypothetical protein